MNRDLLLNMAQLALKDAPYYSPMFPPSPYYRFLRRLAEYLQPQLAVELGVCGGGGSLHMALGYPKGRVVGVDWQFDHPQQIQHIYETCSNFVFHLGDSVEDANQITATYGQCKLLFVDTVHTKTQTILEFEAWHSYLAAGWVVCFDDLLRVEMEDVWEVLPSPKLRLDDLHATAEGGFGVLWQG